MHLSKTKIKVQRLKKAFSRSQVLARGYAQNLNKTKQNETKLTAIGTYPQ